MKLGMVGTTLALALGLAGCGSVVIRNGPDDDGGPQGVDAVVVDRGPTGDTPIPLFDVRPSVDTGGRGCSTDAECGAGYACLVAGGCEVPRTCQPAQRGCTADYAAFCGCDGVTFHGSSSCPQSPWSHRGACETPQVDAGPPGCVLGDGRFCAVGTSCSTGCGACFCFAPGELRCLGGDPGGCDDGGVVPPGMVCEDSRDCPSGSRCVGGEGCGVPWTCQRPDDGCTPDLAAFCGCDGISFEGSSSCPGRPYAHRGNCGIVPRDGGALPPPLCPPQDARGVGNCDAFFGYAWNGATCVGVSGCSCGGSQCGSLASSAAACEAAHMACPRPL